MSEARLTIGGIGLAVCGGDGVEAAMGLPGMAVFADPAGGGDTLLRLDAELPHSALRPLHRFDIADGSRQCVFGVDGEGVYLYDFPGCGRMRFDPARPDVAQCSPIGDPNVLRFAIWTAMSMLGLWRGVLPVHASTVVCGGRAVMCLGESGTGKSTHTRLWLAHLPDTRLLNDDSPMLSLRGSVATVYGSPWSGKTPCYRAERYPAAALLRLEQHPANSIRRLGTLEAFIALQPSCPPCMMKEERLQDRLVDFVGRAIQRIPAYRMGCLPDADAARLSHDTIFGS